VDDRTLALAWAAGFIDGEGCIYIGRQKRSENGLTYSLKLTVSQRDREPLDILYGLFGGYIFQVKSARAWTWDIRCGAAGDALEALLPYLRYKRPQAELALQFQARRGLVYDPDLRRNRSRDPEQDERDYLALRELKVAA
jgi:hypothetical protein